MNNSKYLGQESKVYKTPYFEYYKAHIFIFIFEDKNSNL